MLDNDMFSRSLDLFQNQKKLLKRLKIPLRDHAEDLVK